MVCRNLVVLFWAAFLTLGGVVGGEATKAGHPQEAVGDLKACTYGGKPAKPTEGTGDDVDMDGTTPPPMSAEVLSKAAPPSAPNAAAKKGTKGRGRGSKSA